MNSFFQDSKFSEDNLKLYRDTPESELIRNVNPVAQRQVFRELKKRQKYIQASSLSPEPHQDTAAANVSSTKSLLNPLLRKSRNTLSSTGLSFFPAIGGQQQPDTDSKNKRNNFLSTSTNPLLTSSGSSVQFVNDGSIYDFQPKEQINFPDDRLVHDHNARTGYIKNKYETLMKNTFCLRSKMNSNQFYSTSSRLSNTSSDSALCPLGIFLRKQKPVEEFAEDLSFAQKTQGKFNQQQQQSRYDKIFKMLKLDQPSYLEQSSSSPGFFLSKATPKDIVTGDSNQYQQPNRALKKQIKVATEFDDTQLNDSEELSLPFSNPSQRMSRTQGHLSKSTRLFDRTNFNSIISPNKSSQAIKVILNESNDGSLNQSKTNGTFTEDQTNTLFKSKSSRGITTISSKMIQMPNQLSTSSNNGNTPAVSTPYGNASRQSVRSRVLQQIHVPTDSEDELSSPLITLHNTISVLNVDDPVDDCLSNDEESDAVDEDGHNVMKRNRQMHKTISQSIYKNFSQMGTQKQINDDGEALSDEDGNPLSHNNNRGSGRISHQRNIPSISVNTKMNQDEFDDSNNEAQDSSDEDGSHGFVMKRNINFDQLKQLRDKTINKSSNLNSPMPKKQPQLKLLVQSKLSRQASLNSPATNKVNAATSTSGASPSRNVHSQLATPSINNSNDIVLQPTGDSAQPADANSVGTSAAGTEQTIEDKPKNSKSKQSKKQVQQVTSSLRKFFRKPQKKKQEKVAVVEERNAEEVQREQDHEIATKLEEVKDKLRAGVKVIIRDQIQKRIQSTIALNLLNQSRNNAVDTSFGGGIPSSSGLLAPFQSEQSTPLLKNQSSHLLNESTPSSTSKFNRFSNNQQQQQSQPQQQSSIIDKLKMIPTPSTPLLAHQKNTNTAQKFFASPQLSQYSSLSTKPQHIPMNANALVQQFSPNTSQTAVNMSMNASTRQPQNPSYESQMKEVNEYSSAIMNFFDACIDNLKEKDTAFNHDFQLRNLKGFDSQLSDSLVKTFETELRKQKMSSENVERFKYIYEINTKMHVFYQGMILTLGGIDRVRELIEIVVKKVSSHITLFPINHVYSFDTMHRRIIPAICAVLCDDHRLFLQTLRYFQQQNQTDSIDFSFIDFFFIKKEIFSLLTKTKNNEISSTLALSIMQKTESVRRYIFPLDVLNGEDIRKEIAQNLFKTQPFMEFFNKQTFQLNQINELIDTIFDYFYSDKEDPTVLDFNRIKLCFDQYLLKQVSRKVIDYIEVVTQAALQQDRFTRNVILRDLHYKFSKIRLRFGFKQGVFGVFQFHQMQQLLDRIKDDVISSISPDNPMLLQLSQDEIKKLTDLHFLKYYLRFLLSEYDIFSVYDFSVAMPYFGVTLKIFRFWMASLRNVLLTKYRLMPNKAIVFIRFVEACCPTT